MSVLDNPASGRLVVRDDLAAYLLTARDSGVAELGDDLTRIAPLCETTIAIYAYANAALIFDNNLHQRPGELRAHPIVESAATGEGQIIMEGYREDAQEWLTDHVRSTITERRFLTTA